MQGKVTLSSPAGNSHTVEIISVCVTFRYSVQKSKYVQSSYGPVSLLKAIFNSHLKPACWLVFPPLDKNVATPLKMSMFHYLLFVAAQFATLCS